MLPSLVKASPSGATAPSAQTAAQPTSRTFVLSDEALPDYDPRLRDALTATFAASGYRTQFVSVEDLFKPDVLYGTAGPSLLVLTQARFLPLKLGPVIAEFARRGGNLIVLGAPAFSDPASGKGGGAQSAEAEARARALTLPPSVLLDFRSDFPLDDLIRETNNERSPLKATIEAAPESKASGVAGTLHMQIGNLTGWDIWRTPDLSRSPFGPAQTLTVLSARGGPHTGHLALEWDERDGTRWMATIALSPEWRRYAIAPSDFKPWGVNSADRAKAGFHPAAALRFKAGMAQTHTGPVGGPQEYWIAGVGAESIDDAKANGDLSDDAAPAGGAVASVPVLDMIAPAYKFSPVHGALRIVSPPTAPIGESVSWDEPDPAARQITSAPPRAGGAGFDRGRDFRWEPLLVARDAASSQWRGTPATLVVHKPWISNGVATPGGIRVSIAMGDSAFFATNANIQHVIGNAAARIHGGLFLFDGGAQFDTLLPGQSVRLGADVANESTTDERIAHVRMTIASAEQSVPIWAQSWDAKVKPATYATLTPTKSTTGNVSANGEWTPPASDVPANGWVVTTELMDDRKNVIDRLQQHVFVWTPPAHPQFVTVGDATGNPNGHFSLGGERWRALGVNYTPSSGIASENTDRYQRWTEPVAYDPETVERDLWHIENLGFNAISCWTYSGDAQWQNTLDLLRRCRNHHLKISLMLAPDVGSVKAADDLQGLIKRFRFPENDTLIGYEISWEPEWRDQEARRPLDPDWEAWITAHYGSVQAAERSWGCAVERNSAGGVTNPTASALNNADGPQARMAVAYRRFLDDALVTRYGPVVDRMHAIDPHHLVSFRMNHAGDPTDRGGMPYAFEGVARSGVDYLAPEAYGRVGAWAQVKPGLFTAAYARAVAPNLPVVWAEVGVDTWDRDRNAPDPDRQTFQGQFYADFLRMATRSSADGIYFWMFPGGLRFDEHSDYGLINPDGTDRPASTAVRQAAAAFLAAPLPKPTHWLTFDRNIYANGLVGAYDALSDPFWSAEDNGEAVGLRARRAAP